MDYYHCCWVAIRDQSARYGRTDRHVSGIICDIHSDSAQATAVVVAANKPIKMKISSFFRHTTLTMMMVMVNSGQLWNGMTIRVSHEWDDHRVPTT